MIETRVDGKERLMSLEDAQRMAEEGHTVELRDGTGEWRDIERIAPKLNERDGVLGI
jgi:hypothetical protein